MKLYLAHPLEDRIKFRNWQIKIEREIGINIVNPFYDVYNPHIEELDAGKKIKNLDYNMIVQRDISLIAASDGIITIINNTKSYGTIQEMVYAKMLNKPVYSLITSGDINHSWLKYHSTKRFGEYKRLENFLKELK